MLALKFSTLYLFEGGLRRNAFGILLSGFGLITGICASLPESGTRQGILSTGIL
jgi:hypothetical protein